jgi:hypothetical protein
MIVAGADAHEMAVSPASLSMPQHGQYRNQQNRGGNAHADQTNYRLSSPDSFSLAIGIRETAEFATIIELTRPTCTPFELTTSELIASTHATFARVFSLSRRQRHRPNRSSKSATPID